MLGQNTIENPAQAMTQAAIRLGELVSEFNRALPALPDSPKASEPIENGAAAN
jgi:hypothetical protein